MKDKVIRQEKYHWYLSSYVGFNENKNELKGYSYEGLSNMNITKSIIDEMIFRVKKSEQMKSLAIVSISYLGYMTENEFNP